MINDAPGCFDYDEAGAGPTIVLVPGSCSTGAAWRPIIYRCRSPKRWLRQRLLPQSIIPLNHHSFPSLVGERMISGLISDLPSCCQK